MAMATATLAMYFACDSYLLINGGRFDFTTLVVFIVIVLLFSGTCWARIKRKIPSSFLIAMLILLIANSIMFYGSINTKNNVRYYTEVTWEDKDNIYEYGGQVNLVLPWSYYIENEDKAKAELLNMREELVKSLHNEGKNVYGLPTTVYANGDISVQEFFREERYYPSSELIWSSIVMVIATIALYIVYSIIAYKKGWKF